MLYPFFKKLFIASLFILSILVQSQQNGFAFDSTYAAKLQLSLNQIKAQYNLPGISAAVIVPGQGTWTGSSGISDSTMTTITPDMIFGIGSITKNYAAALTLKMQEQGLLSIDDSIKKYLPHYNNVDSNITIRELLQHTSGLYNYTDNSAWGSAVNSNFDSIWIAEDIAANYILAPLFVHGTSWSYSNTNYLLLGIILSNIGQMPFNELLRQKLFDPLQIDNMYVYSQDSLEQYHVHNWVDLNGDGIPDDASYIPMTSIYSSTITAGALIAAPLNVAMWAKRLFGGSVLNPHSLHDMITFRNVSFGAGVNGYGLGTFRYITQGRTMWGHGGNIFGYAAFMAYYPVDSIAVAIITNRDIGTTTFGFPFINSVINNRPVGIQPISEEIPGTYKLDQNFPNPFNPVTNIGFKISKADNVTLKIYNALGKNISTLVSDNLKPGSYRVKWDGSNVSSGIYFYTLTTGNFTQTKKMLLIK